MSWLPDTVTELGDSCFYNTRFESIDISHVTKIGSSLFSNNTKLKSITFGEGLTEIPSYTI